MRRWRINPWRVGGAVLGLAALAVGGATNPERWTTTGLWIFGGLGLVGLVLLFGPTAAGAARRREGAWIGSAPDIGGGPND